MKSVVITGASSGIGKETCKIFLEEKYLVFGSVRNKKDALKLSLEFGNDFIPLIFDVTDKNSVETSRKKVEQVLGNKKLDLLINNAGVALLGPLAYMNIEEFEEQLNVNLKGNLICTQVFLPILGMNSKLKGKPGSIINISSALGGKIGAPFYGAYCSSKHALEGLSESLRRELSIFGIKVVVIAPGAVSTPIWNKVNYKDHISKYRKTEYLHSYQKNLDLLTKLNQTKLTSQKVSKFIFKVANLRKPKSKYYIIQNITLLLILIAPKFIVDICFKKYFSLSENNKN